MRFVSAVNILKKNGTIHGGTRITAPHVPHKNRRPRLISEHKREGEASLFTQERWVDQ